jgi:hypothetical protein
MNNKDFIGFGLAAVLLNLILILGAVAGGAFIIKAVLL